MLIVVIKVLESPKSMGSRYRLEQNRYKGLTLFTQPTYELKSPACLGHFKKVW